MARRPDAGLEVALEQRRQTFDFAQQALAERERSLQVQAQALADAQARVRMVLMQMDATQRPAVGMSLPVDVLGDLERLLDWCEVQVLVQEQRLHDVQVETDEARGVVATAHQAVKALELVLAKRAAERAELRRRQELRDADETAARVHARNAAAA
jgi:Flagellar FliJ protein